MIKQVYFQLAIPPEVENFPFKTAICEVVKRAVDIQAEMLDLTSARIRITNIIYRKGKYLNSLYFYVAPDSSGIVRVDDSVLYFHKAEDEENESSSAVMDKASMCLDYDLLDSEDVSDNVKEHFYFEVCVETGELDQPAEEERSKKVKKNKQKELRKLIRSAEEESALCDSVFPKSKSSSGYMLQPVTESEAISYALNRIDEYVRMLGSKFSSDSNPYAPNSISVWAGRPDYTSLYAGLLDIEIFMQFIRRVLGEKKYDKKLAKLADMRLKIAKRRTAKLMDIAEEKRARRFKRINNSVILEGEAEEIRKNLTVVVYYVRMYKLVEGMPYLMELMINEEFKFIGKPVFKEMNGLGVANRYTLYHKIQKVKNTNTDSDMDLRICHILIDPENLSSRENGFLIPHMTIRNSIPYPEIELWDFIDQFKDLVKSVNAEYPENINPDIAYGMMCTGFMSAFTARKVFTGSVNSVEGIDVNRPFYVKDINIQVVPYDGKYLKRKATINGKTCKFVPHKMVAGLPENLLCLAVSVERDPHGEVIGYILKNDKTKISEFLGSVIVRKKDYPQFDTTTRIAIGRTRFIVR